MFDLRYAVEKLVLAQTFKLKLEITVFSSPSVVKRTRRFSEDNVKHFFFGIVILASTCLLFAQDIQVNRQNKTIAVTADDSVTADAEIAVLAIGYHNYAPT